MNRDRARRIDALCRMPVGLARGTRRSPEAGLVIMSMKQRLGRGLKQMTDPSEATWSRRSLMRNIFFKTFSILMVFVFLLTLFGCSAVPVPPESKPDAFQQPTHHEVEIPSGKTTRSIALKKFVVVIARGKTTEKHSDESPGHVTGKTLWTSWEQRTALVHFIRAFNEKLKELHYNVIAASNNLFEDKMSPPELVVGAVISNATRDLYSKKDILHKISGHESVSLTIEWQVFDTIQQQVVYKKTTTGHADMDVYNLYSTDSELLSRAFLDSFGCILDDNNFVSLVSQGEAPSSQKNSKANDTSMLDSTYITKYKHTSKTRPLSEICKSVVTVQVGSAHGSGFVVFENGLILTSRHVVSGADTVHIITYDGRILDATVVKRNNERDVAVLLAKEVHLPALAVNTEKLSIGAEVFAIGSPKDIKLSGTVTNGIISSYRELKKVEWIQSNAVINQGSSGGPLVDSKGSVVGISTRILRDANGIYFYTPIGDAISKLGIHLR
jgi:serine protease Do